MPRKPTNDDAIRYARFFLDNFIERTNSADHILPKNEIYSPFVGFCRVFPLYAKKKDGGAATDGVSRAAFNKICLEYFEEGMRKPARNGNPGALEANLAQQRRHFLRGRWRDPSMEEDSQFLRNLWAALPKEQMAAAESLLAEFSRWKPGPAGRGGERVSKKRSSPCHGDCSDEDGEEGLSWSCDGSGDAPAASSRSRDSDSDSPIVVPSSPDSVAVSAPASKRHHSGGPRRCVSSAATAATAVTGEESAADSGMLDILCMVASTVDNYGEAVINPSSSHPESSTAAAGASAHQPSSVYGGAQGSSDAGVVRQGASDVAVTPKREVTELASPPPLPEPAGWTSATQPASVASGRDWAWAASAASDNGSAGLAPPPAARRAADAPAPRRLPGSIASICCSPYFSPAPPPAYAPPTASLCAAAAAASPSLAPGMGPAPESGGWRGRAVEVVPAPFASLYLEPSAGVEAAAGRHLLRV